MFFANQTAQKSKLENKNNLIARNAGSRGMVLLENSGILPIQPCPVALYGNGARNTVKGGKGSGDVNQRDLISIEQGLENAGFEVVTKNWLDCCDDVFTEDEAKWEEQIFKTAEHTQIGVVRTYLETVHLWPKPPIITTEHIPENVDTAIYVIARRCGEGADRVLEQGDYYLYPEEEEGINLLEQHFKKIIIILNVGGIIDTAFYETMKDKGALVLMGQPGQCAGDALVDILTAKITPSGKLTATWAKEYKDYPVSEVTTSKDGRKQMDYKQGIFVGYRHFDQYDISASYPFGYGLSYTQFKYSDTTIDYKPGWLQINLKVKNVGNRFRGQDTIQIYAQLPSGKINKPKKVLIGFEKTSLLEVDGEQIISKSIPINTLASYCEQKEAFIIEAGNYDIQLGSDSESLQKLGTINFKDELIINEIDGSYKEDNGLYKEIVDGLTQDQIISLVVGHYHQKEDIVGSASGLVPGAAGETSHKIKDLPIVVMADGPSGLRLIQHFQTDQKDNLLEIGFMAGLENGRFTPKSKIKTEDARDYYQYCTCFPTGTTLAQSWDESLLVEVGEAVAEEMRHFGVHLWLAPGMNIQSEPLCGRNYEYYSEDPILTGKVAAAMVRGVQKGPKTGAVIKHFACNNLEDGRLGGDSIVEKQALKEIYLKAFEIAIQESNPAGIMTGYNFLNGIHCANSKELCTLIARDQWKYEGVIMTDWGATDFGAKADLCIEAGNDLIMPGSEEDVSEIKKALEIGSLSYEELKKCAVRVVRMIKKLELR